MIVKTVEEITIFETPDGGKTVYTRKPGEKERNLVHADENWKREQTVNIRWLNLRQAIHMALDDPTLNDAISKVEVLYALKKEEI